MKDFSNYHNVNPNEKLTHDGLSILEESLSGFAGYDVTINETVQSRILLYEKWDSNSETKKVIGRIEDIEQGNLFKIGDLNWLVVTFPEDNKIYRKAELRLCNSTFLLEIDKTKELKGKDSLGRPVYEEVLVTKNEPCIVETNYYMNNRNEQITLPSDSVMITLKYQKALNLDINKEFDLYNSRFRITFVDYSKVILDKGVMTITGERVMNK